MKALHTGVLALLLTVLPTTVSADEDKNLAGCSVELSSYIYNLQQLSRPANDKDYKVKFNDGKYDWSVAFSVCDMVLREPLDAQLSFANMLHGSSSNGDYRRLTSDNIEDVQVELLDENRPDIGLKLVYENSGVRCDKEEHNYSFTIEAICDEDATESIATFKASSLKNPCSPAVELVSPYACPSFSLHSLWAFFEKYSIGFGCLLISLGLFLMVFGGRYYKATMFIAAQFVITGLLMVLLFVAIMPSGTPEWSVWVSLLVALGIGSGVGFIAKRFSRIGVLFVGAILGSFVGMTLFNSFVYKLSQENTLLGLWMTIMVTAMIIGGLCMVFFDNAVIIGSSITGAYMLYRGISVFAGGYPNEFLIYEDYKNNKLTEMPISFIVYTALMSISAVIALVYQSRHRASNEDAYSYRQYDFKYRRV